ncbi:MAG TPA: SIS domain-containing protein [Acidimicrobiales bacterium]|nr:SIS domain-containing protein [Acidimicrobiales bacterium]
MCGIIAVVRRPGSRRAPESGDVVGPLHEAMSALAGGATLSDACATAAGLVEAADAQLRGAEGVHALVHDRRLLAEVEGVCASLASTVAVIEARLDEGAGNGAAGDGGAGAEAVNAAVTRLKDAVWAVERDRARTARAVADLAGSEPCWAATEGYTSIQQALSAIDRLEVRGRDSAGVHVLVRDHGLDLDSAAVRGLLGERARDPLFRSGAVRVVDGCLAFVYKAAAEIGELGDNTRALREAIRGDELLRLALGGTDASAVVLGHTRWASVGIISQPNAHPVDSAEEGSDGAPYIVAALNGDVDNFADLKALDGLRIAPEITTDAKVIPTLVARRVAEGSDLAGAFRSSVASFEGSVAIAAAASAAPDQVLLALRGSGQALYVGLADDAYVVASEPYGVIEMTPRYVRMDGETPANPDNPTASRGQIVVLDGRRAGTPEGVGRVAYDGTPLPVTEADMAEAQITTRDIDRGTFPHFLLKEITESPASFRKTLRGKMVERDGALAVVLGPEALPDDVRSALRDGRIRRVLVVGQGTAAVAGQAMAAALEQFCAEAGPRVEALPATELSGFGLRPDMSGTLVVAISQSGTTTDTNRTVDLVRSRGARVIAIVNRRGSDLTDKADGVLYTSDGRDVEMSVASTKAFYSQIAAGLLLAAAVAAEVGGKVDQAVLRALRDLPAAMAEVVARRPAVAEAAHRLAPSKRYWAVVGNGVNRIAAAEVRIKLSELCYKSIASDSTEDKKHIDLSSEPLILVCAAGLVGSTADDVAKEVAIYRAHKASPIVIATDGQSRFASALHVLTVPETHPALAFVLSAMAGHLFGYEAALAIDAQARPLREARAAIEAVTASGDGGGRRDGEAQLRRLARELEPVTRRYFDGLRVGAYNGHLEASTAVRLAALFRYALGILPLEAYSFDGGKVGTPAVVIDDLTGALTVAIEELTRPVDAIKHQAKTVTVGISRSDETLLEVPLVREVVATGAPRDQLTYRTLRTLADISPSVAGVVGFTRYAIEGRPGDDGDATIAVVDRGGIARDLPSRTERSPELRGTKHRVANEREVLVARGRRDGRTLVIVPEVKDGQTTGITLLHVRFADRLPVATARGVLQGYRNRYAVLRDAVQETEPTFREDLLADIPVDVLLTDPINQLADRWRTA